MIRIFFFFFFFAILEKDDKGDVMWVWSFPTVDPGFRELLMRKCTLNHDEKDEEQPEELEYSYGHLANVWYYLKNVKNDGRSPLNKVKRCVQ